MNDKDELEISNKEIYESLGIYGCKSRFEIRGRL